MLTCASWWLSIGSSRLASHSFSLSLRPIGLTLRHRRNSVSTRNPICPLTSMLISIQSGSSQRIWKIIPGLGGDPRAASLALFWRLRALASLFFCLIRGPLL
ncbi:hypothetical protein KC19_9G132800 [Ceratodon purpureus]|uniref:Uncharacterized protein n=1 Tax=Ceratodon purpureus TaxID=3225 RepID=A0A8T0GV39_CERPU|nr:hypothetical protein KC19_9G132800 [Ceratodon purpureus]